jgi:hypothetical protein
MWIRPQLPSLPDGISVTIGPLVGLPDDREGWIANALLDGLSPEIRVQRLATSEVTHASGWPVTVVAIAALDREREVERRIAIMFRLEVVGALVMVRVAPAAIGALEASLGRSLLEALLAAPVRMHDTEVVAIAELDA